MSEETVTISKFEYDEMNDRLKFLAALEAAGVDNWDGYGHAWEIYEEGDSYFE